MEEIFSSQKDSSAGGRHILLDARLSAAAELIENCDTFADIGCDHGRLACSMLQRNACVRCVASDLSEPSLDKAKQLAAHIGIAHSIDFRIGSGLSVLKEGEADAIAILGMGGKLIAQILSACPVALMGAKRAVFQPMRGVEELRKYLWDNGYRIEHDRVVRDEGRLYQIFSVLPPDATVGTDTLPNGFPEGCFSVGYRAFFENDPYLIQLVYRELNQCRKRLREAKGTDGEQRLLAKGMQLEQIFRQLEA